MAKTKTKQSAASKLHEIGDILSDSYGAGDCYCERCSKKRVKIKDYKCPFCGNRKFAIDICTCETEVCKSSAALSNCFHGIVYCPVCANGEEDKWKIVRAIREVLERE